MVICETINYIEFVQEKKNIFSCEVISQKSAIKETEFSKMIIKEKGIHI